MDGVDIMKKLVFYNISRSFDYLTPGTYPKDDHPMWLPNFDRMQLCVMPLACLWRINQQFLPQKWYNPIHSLAN
jgi:hypothetical protein